MISKLILVIMLCQEQYWSVRSYTVPPAKIEVFTPKGFRASIPAEEGATLFAFHGKINEEFEGIEAGTWNVDILKVREGRYTYTNKDAKIKIGDTLYFWTYVIYEGLGYRQDNGEYKVLQYANDSSTLPPTTGSRDCSTKSVTQVKGTNPCPGAVIFQDDFNSIDDSKWLKERRFYAEPDFDFAFYLSEGKNVFVNNGILHIRPLRAEEQLEQEDVIYEDYEIKDGCTGKSGTAECVSIRDTGFVLQPMISGRINTQKSFSFIYGKIEIRAKVPFEDWIFPQMLLEPITKSLGSSGCETGQMRVGLTRGTDNELYGGALLSTTGPARWLKLCRCNFGNEWHTDFHEYTIVWSPDSISVSVDNREYCRIDPPQEGFGDLKVNNKRIEGSDCWTTKIAPFDKEFYLALGVGVGGINDFPDNLRWHSPKPWVNEDVRGMTYFWRQMKSKSNWPNKDASTLQIDYVRISAI